MKYSFSMRNKLIFREVFAVLVCEGKLLIKFVFYSNKVLGLLMFCRREEGMRLEKQGSFWISGKRPGNKLAL